MPLDVLRNRSPGSLLPFLGSVAAIALACFFVGRMVPALRELFFTIYLLLAIVSAVFIVRWARTRKGDRRRTDRRSPPDAS